MIASIFCDNDILKQTQQSMFFFSKDFVYRTVRDSGSERDYKITHCIDFYLYSYIYIYQPYILMEQSTIYIFNIQLIQKIFK